MGSIRTLLAIAVVLGHTYGFVFVGGQLAVQLFYIISGFLMSLVITQAKTYGSVQTFYLNRMLRLFPVYFFVALLTLAIYLTSQFLLGMDLPFFATYENIDLLGALSLIASNVLLFGQDWIMFTGIKDGVFQWVTDFRDSDVQVHNGLLVPQAWTLGVELSFYAIAPFVLPRKWLIFVLLSFSIGIRVYLVKLGIGLQDPWTYRFFPAELAFFLLGALSHQYLTPLYARISQVARGRVAEWAVIFVVLYCLSFHLIPGSPGLLNFGHDNEKTLLLFFLVIFTLPLLLEFQSNNQWDQTIGNLSYPIYISHMLVSFVASMLWSTFGEAPGHSVEFAAIVVAFTLLFSWAIERYLNGPVERLRILVKKRSTQ